MKPMLKKNSEVMPRILIVLLLIFTLPSSAKSLNIEFLYLHQTPEIVSGLANTIRAPIDQGLRGAELGVEDSNSTGKFLDHAYQLNSFEHSDTQHLVDYASNWVNNNNNRIILANVKLNALLALTELEVNNTDHLVINVAEKSDALRTTECKARLLHTIPSRAMLTDSLLQFLNAKRWNKFFLVSGEHADDKLYAQSLKRSLKRFGGKLVEQKSWTFNTDLRRTVQKEIPLFTRADDYDVVLVADESGYFGNSMLYNTWLPRPIAGTQGLMPTGWHRSVEQWGALQLQSRFFEQSQRWMNDVDFAAWVAIRALSEAVTRTQSNDAETLYAYLLSDEFEVAAFKGRKLSFRTWNGQLKQPIPIIHPQGLVSQSPQEGYLHPSSELDTLGYDAPEVVCKFKANR